MSLVALLMVISCTGAGPSREKAQEIWKKQEGVVADAAQGERVSLQDFREACIFFEEVAGINVPGDASTFVDWYPTKDTRRALEPIKRWYAMNGDRLYWDDERQLVGVRGTDSGEPGNNRSR